MESAATPFDEVFKQCRDMDASLAERLSIFADAVRARRRRSLRPSIGSSSGFMTAAPATPPRSRATRCRLLSAR